MINHFGNTIWKLFRKIVTWFLRDLFRLKLTGLQLESFFQFVKFGLVGISNTVVNYLVYVLCVALGMYYMLANLCAFVVSVLNSFFWNNRYVFKETGEGGRSLPLVLLKTFIAYGATGLVLNSILLYVEVDLLHFHKMLAPLLNLIVTIPLNYIINKFWAFKDK